MWIGMVVVIVLWILIAMVSPSFRESHDLVRNDVRIKNMKQLKTIIEQAIQFNNGYVTLSDDIHCVNDKLIKELNIPTDLIQNKDIFKDIGLNWINYWTKVWWCRWKYWFVYNEKEDKIWIIATMETEKNNSESKQWNANIDLKYYKNFPNIGLWHEEDKFINVFDANKWKLWNNNKWNSYVEIIDIKKLRH